MRKFKKEIVDKDFIESLIPQRPPFVMVDKLIYFKEGEITAGLYLLAENIFIDKDDQFAAAGLIEHMAQTVALYTGYEYYQKNKKPPVGYIGAIKSVNINRLPKSGDELKTNVIVLHEIMGVVMVKAETTCGDEVLAYGEMKTVLAE